MLLLLTLLSTVKELGSGTRSEIADRVDPEHEQSSSELDSLIENAEKKGYVSRNQSQGGEHLILTADGAAFLAEELLSDGAEVEAVEVVETEPLGSDELILNHPYDVSKLRVASLQLSVFQVLRKIDRKEIVLNPDFQRAFVWDSIRQSRLIESVLIRIPLPAFYVDATGDESWAVVDGLQRLRTLFDFWKDKFELRGLQFLREMEGMRFTELPARLRVQIEDNTQLQFYQLQPGTPPQAKFTIFSRLNTGGVTLTTQEIRHALFPGPGNDLLKQTAASPLFVEVTGGSVSSKRMEDREAVLRAYAFLVRGPQEYKTAEFDAFLNDSIGILNSSSTADREKLQARLFQSLEKARAIFGTHAFRKVYREGSRRLNFNKALFETWVYALDQHSIEALRERRDVIRDEFVKLMNTDWHFNRSISYGTGSVASVRVRFSTIEKLLRSCEC